MCVGQANSMNEFDIFVAAAEKDGAELDAFLSQECANAPEMRQRIYALLSAHQQSGVFVDKLASASPAASEPLATNIGCYKLLEQIGEGGFGVVYMAEQMRPVRRRVALKIIKLGMDTKQVVARFDAERQAIAMMDHPNIASVFDVGATESGRPYFVMELVRGESLTKYCDKQRLCARDRLEIFVDICRAIQHAHQKGVIHRDIKPSNVLVTIYDAKPLAKVIDFGIAKATEEPLTEKTVFTQFRQMIGTPAYMSPEQALLNATDVDTRTDIYSLGVLLYELLTGETPLDMQTLRSKSYEELLRQIREVEAPSLGARLTALDDRHQRETAENRRLSPPELVRLVGGELNWITSKALEKDRTRRYESASALADDVERYLRNEPVTARPPSARYRMLKFVSRNRGLVAAASAVVAALLVGLVLSVTGVVQARRQAEIALAQTEEATAQAQRAKTTFKLLQELLLVVDPEQGHRPNITVREMLDKFCQRLLERPIGEPDVEAEIHNIVANTYQRLGLRNIAEPHWRKVVELRKIHASGNDLSVAEAYVNVAENAISRCHYWDAIEANDKAIEIYNELQQTVPTRVRQIEGISSEFVRLTELVAERCAQFQHRDLLQEIMPHFDEHPEHLTGTLFSDVVYLLLDVGEYRLAEELCIERGADLSEMGPVDQALWRSVTSAFLAVIYRAHDEPHREQVIYSNWPEYIGIQEEWYETNPWSRTADASRLLHQKSSEFEDVQQALPLAEQAVTNATVVSYTSASAYQTLAQAQWRHGNIDQAIRTQKQAMAKLPGERLFLRGQFEMELAHYLESAGRPEEAREVLEAGLKWRRAKLPPDYVQNSVAEVALALHLLRFPNDASSSGASNLLDSAYQRVIDRPEDDYYRNLAESALRELESRSLAD